MAGQGLSYNVDIVMCIDCTGSMGPLLNVVKGNALKFYPDVKAACAEKNKQIDQLRIRVIGFRDSNCDKEKSFADSGFLNIPEQEAEFKNFVNNFEADGGGDEPECGLEAVAMALDSEWTKGGDKRRHVVVVWSDASTHPLEEPSTKTAYYPQGMPSNFDELTDWWEDDQMGKMEKTAKRCIIFAPDAASWTDMGLNWTNTIHHTAKASDGLSDVDYETIIASIVNSI